jgi:hypothetical protein
MIRIASQSKSVTPEWHEVFLKMAPAIEVHAKIAFRHLRSEARAEAVQDVLCNACSALARLAELNKLDLAYPSVLARFGVAQVNDGRKLGCRLNVRDVSSAYCQRTKGVVMERLDKFDRTEEAWEEIVVEDKNVGPAEVAATKIDFSAWLRVLPGRLRRIAEILAVGETTTAVARRFYVSPSRISQIRSELCRSWQQFQGEATGTPCAAVA